MTPGVERFRRLALALADVVESSHMGNPDFRAGGRIFATLSAQARGRGMVKLTLEQQAEFVSELPEVFEPVPGGWGRMGRTLFSIARTKRPCGAHWRPRIATTW